MRETCRVQAKIGLRLVHYRYDHNRRVPPRSQSATLAILQSSEKCLLKVVHRADAGLISRGQWTRCAAPPTAVGGGLESSVSPSHSQAARMLVLVPVLFSRSLNRLPGPTLHGCFYTYVNAINGELERQQERALSVEIKLTRLTRFSETVSHLNGNSLTECGCRQ